MKKMSTEDSWILILSLNAVAWNSSNYSTLIFVSFFRFTGICFVYNKIVMVSIVTVLPSKFFCTCLVPTLKSKWNL